MRLTRRAAIFGAIVAPLAALLKKDEPFVGTFSGPPLKTESFMGFSVEGEGPLAYTKECRFEFKEAPCTFTSNESERYTLGYDLAIVTDDESRTIEACREKFDNSYPYRGRPNA